MNNYFACAILPARVSIQSLRRGEATINAAASRTNVLVQTSGVGRRKQRITALATRSGGCMNMRGVLLTIG